jgi:hypothetical protein
MAKLVIYDVTFSLGGGGVTELNGNYVVVPDYYETFAISNLPFNLQNPPLADGPAVLNRTLIETAKAAAAAYTGSTIKDSDILFQPFANI